MRINPYLDEIKPGNYIVAVVPGVVDYFAGVVSTVSKRLWRRDHYKCGGGFTINPDKHWIVAVFDNAFQTNDLTSRLRAAVKTHRENEA